MSLLLDILTAQSRGMRREKLKQLIGALGHEPGWAQKLRAELLARGRRRVDRVAKSAIAVAERNGTGSLAGQRIMEFGAGYVLSVPIVYWLAGAREVVATDYYPILDFAASRRALHKMDERDLVRRLSAIADPADIQARLAKLLALRHWTPERLAEFGIRYVAPLDASAPMRSIGAFDCIVSNSTMEHVPRGSAQPILQNLQDLLVPGGCQIHTIHLEDHRDLARDPFAFLGADDDYVEGQSDARGNRLRASDWLHIARSIPGAAIETLAERVNTRAALPAALDPRFAIYAQGDLKTASITLRLLRQL